MRSMRKRLHRAHNSRRRSVALSLERLDSRMLLSVATDWTGPGESVLFDDGGCADPVFLDGGGYSEPDLFFADPLLLDSSSVYDMIAGEPVSEPEAGPSDSAESYVSPLSASGSYTLFLDFDGATVYSRTGDFWLGSTSVTVPAYSLGSFGWAGREQESIAYITDFVVEDYAAYNVNVTTTEPTSGEYTTIYVGGGNSWFQPHTGVIGVATYDIGNRDASNYGFAFTDELSIYQSYCGGSLQNFSEYVANLITHEAGHTFGANHVDDPTATMNPYLALHPRRTMFGAGPIPNSSQSQDTQSQLGGNLGYGHGPDDYGDDGDSASTVSESTVVSGLLERRDDVDAFQFTAAVSGRATLDIDTEYCGNLDSLLSVVRQSDGALVGQNDDFNGDRDSALTVQVAEGETYTVLVASSDGLSSGSYSLTMDLPEVNPTPEMVIVDSVGSGGDYTVSFGGLDLGDVASGELFITNEGSADLVISQLEVAGDDEFELDVTSAAHTSVDDIRIAPGDTFVVTCTYRPEDVADYSGQIVIAGNDPEHGMAVVALSGTVRQPQPDVVVSPSLDFGAVLRGQTKSEAFTISNEGVTDLLISEVTAGEAFTLTGYAEGETVTLSAGERLTLTVAVTPLHRGELDGQIVIVCNDPDQPTTVVDVDGQVLGGVLGVQESSGVYNDDRVDFGSVYLGETSSELIRLVNEGDGPLLISGITVSGPFVLDMYTDVHDGADDVILSPGGWLDVNVSMTSEELGAVTGSVIVSSDDFEAGALEVRLAGTGVSAMLELTESDGVADGQKEFGAAQRDMFSRQEVWEIRNHGNVPVTVTFALADGTDFRLPGLKSITLAPDQEYTLDILTNPTVARRVTDVLTVRADDPQSTTYTLGLAADGYALVANHESYTFTDHSGDVVTVSMSGQGRAKVVLGGAGQTDIESIELVAGTVRDRLTIGVRGGGETTLGELTGAANLGMISARKVDVTGGGIDIDGVVGRIDMGDLGSGSRLSFTAGQRGMVRLGSIGADAAIDVSGQLKVLMAEDFGAARMEVDAIDRVLINDDLAGTISLGQGVLRCLTVKRGDFTGALGTAGSVDKVVVGRGDLGGTVNAGGAIDTIMVGRGALSGSVRTSEAINRVVAYEVCGAEITALKQINQINVKGDMTAALVAVGYGENLDSRAAAAVAQVDAHLGMLRVGGYYADSTVAVGLAPGEGGSFLNGTHSAASGAIDKILLRYVDSSEAEDHFGLVAQDDIGRLRVEQVALNSDDLHQGDYRQDYFVVTVLDK